MSMAQSTPLQRDLARLAGWEGVWAESVHLIRKSTTKPQKSIANFASKLLNPSSLLFQWLGFSVYQGYEFNFFFPC